MRSNGMATSSALYLIITQIASRALTFIGNQVLLRYLSPTLLGISVQLELLSVTILYFARESLRVALQRQPSSDDTTTKKSDHDAAQRRSQSSVNLAYLAVGLGHLIGLGFGLWYLRVADREVLSSANFTTAFLTYGLATVIELFSEPFFLIIQQHSLYSARAKAETTAAISRCLAACVTAQTLHSIHHPPSVLPFAIGQLTYAITLFLNYYLPASHTASIQHFYLHPTPITTPTHTFSLFNTPTLSLASTLYLQSIFKLLLTQGDALLLSLLTTLSSQGSFALAANYGGLLARLIFQPIEESSRAVFGRLLSSPTPSIQNTTQALSHLSSLTHFYLLATMPLVCLIPPLIPLLAPYLFTTQFRTHNIISLLSTYIYYIPFMALNGILDSFVTSVATPSQLRLQSFFLALFTAMYGVAAWLFLKKWDLGSEGLVWANMVNMGLRIVWSIWFIKSWIKKQTDGDNINARFWRECRPSSVVVLLSPGVLAGQIVTGMHRGMHEVDGEIDMGKVGSFALYILLFATVILIFERHFLMNIIQTLVPERLASKIPFLSSKHSSSTAAAEEKRKKEL